MFAVRRGARLPVLAQGGAPFTPASISGLKLWLKSDAGLYQERTGASATTLASADSDPVGSWLDQSGNGNHATAPTDACRPLLKTAIQNGRNIVRFDGTDDSLTGTGVSIANAAFSVFVVRKSSFASGPRVVFSVGGEASSYNTLHIKQTASTSESFDLYEMAVFVTTTLSDFAIYHYKQASNKTMSYNKNGTALNSSVSPSFFTGTSSYSVGKYAGANILFFIGDIAEILVYAGALSAGNIASVEAYLNSRWAVY